jgi:hypothetical protein
VDVKLNVLRRVDPNVRLVTRTTRPIALRLTRVIRLLTSLTRTSSCRLTVVEQSLPRLTVCIRLISIVFILIVEDACLVKSALVNTKDHHVVVLDAEFEDRGEDVRGALFGNLHQVQTAHRQVKLLVTLLNFSRRISAAHYHLIQDVHDLRIVKCLAHQRAEQRANIDLASSKRLGSIILRVSLPLLALVVLVVVALLDEEGDGRHLSELSHDGDVLVVGLDGLVHEDSVSIDSCLPCSVRLETFCQDDDRFSFLNVCFLEVGRV